MAHVQALSFGPQGAALSSGAQALNPLNPEHPEPLRSETPKVI